MGLGILWLRVAQTSLTFPVHAAFQSREHGMHNSHATPALLDSYRHTIADALEIIANAQETIANTQATIARSNATLARLNQPASQSAPDSKRDH